MASKPPIRDSSITESQLSPHLRRRLKGTGGNTLTISSPPPTTDTPLAHYTHATTQSVTVDGWDSAQVPLTAATAVISASEVTATSPWTLTADGLYIIEVTADVTIDAGVGGVVVALAGPQRDMASQAVFRDGVIYGRWYADIDPSLTVSLRIHAASPQGGSVSVTALGIRVWQVE